MHIVICDDNIEDLLTLEKLILKYTARYPAISFETEKFSDASVLLHKIQKEKIADIYILDIIMSRISGIDLGSQIRKSDSKSMIIYVTSSDDFALDAYDIHAIRYLLKPIHENNFFEALDFAIAYTGIKESTAYLVKTKDGLISVLYSKIEYIENCSRRLKIHLTNGETITSIYIRTSFDEEIRELENDSRFLRVHKSFLINLNCVKQLTKNTVTMESSHTLPVSRSSALDVKKQYLLFISEQYR
ncbi:MAG: LytTR family DNA-binding domain-containing protein [Lachnospiraceae bacterium]|jgi:Response regulator of the LytR/AlgR family|nr:response regulator transcription factor [Lachnospiraceae bacterium]MCI9370267.1 response regulator transcription factor [Lachnospiraceae bacterium]